MKFLLILFSVFSILSVPAEETVLAGSSSEQTKMEQSGCRPLPGLSFRPPTEIRPLHYEISGAAATEISSTELMNVQIGAGKPISLDSKDYPFYTVGFFSPEGSLATYGIRLGLTETNRSASDYGISFAVFSSDLEHVSGIQFALAGKAASLYGVQIMPVFSIADLLYGWQVSLIAAKAKTGAGLQTGGWASFAEKNFCGLQTAAGGAFAGDFHGLQLAGFCSKATGMTGLQLAGFGNGNFGSTAGGQISGLFNLVRKSTDGFQLCLLANSSGDLNGFQGSLIANSSGDLNGFQGGALINSAGNLNGFQGGTLMNSSGNLNGFQGTLLTNSADNLNGGQNSLLKNAAKNVNGAQNTLGLNSADNLNGTQNSLFKNSAKEVNGAQNTLLMNFSDHLNGAQNSLFRNTAKNVKGSQNTLVLNSADDLTGIQNSLLTNFAKDVKGAQNTLMANFAKEVNGSQISAFCNDAEVLRGFQIGLVNRAKKSGKGIQIGLVNQLENGPLRWFPFFNFNF